MLQRPQLQLMPCCYDALSARLVEQAGFPLTFVSGFSVSASRALPDTGLLSYGEMLDSMRNVSAAVCIPCIGDGDTGYGNEVNVKRTVRGYAQAGLAAIMIEDQVSPKRCGHTAGKAVIPFDEAVRRVEAAVDAAKEGGDNILILARTDARGKLGLSEGIERCKAFAEVGAHITFLEAPRSREEMAAYCDAVPGPKMANLLAGGLTPVLPPAELEALGYSLAAYPLDLLNASIVAMRTTLKGLRDEGKPPDELTLPFKELQNVIGFEEYNKEAGRCALDKPS